MASAFGFGGPASSEEIRQAIVDQLKQRRQQQLQGMFAMQPTSNFLQSSGQLGSQIGKAIGMGLSGGFKEPDYEAEAEADARVLRARQQEADALNIKGIMSGPDTLTNSQQRLVIADRLRQEGYLEEADKQLSIALQLKEAEDVGEDALQSAEHASFEDLIKNFSEAEKERARRIKAGLKPRATGSAAQTIAAEGLTGDVARSEAEIASAVEFSKKTGASRAKAIDSGFEKIQAIDKNVSNLRRAIDQVRGGAGTGVLQKQLPSLRAASVELDQIRGDLALDVVGAVTFGALSEGELELAKDVALPTGLDGPELVDHIEKRIAAQEKLRGYLEEQIDHLDTGGTIAGFLRKKRRQQKEAKESPAISDSRPDAPARSPEEIKSRVLVRDAQGNKAWRYQDGTYEEIN